MLFLVMTDTIVYVQEIIQAEKDVNKVFLQVLNFCIWNVNHSFLRLWLLCWCEARVGWLRSFCLYKATNWSLAAGSLTTQDHGSSFSYQIVCLLNLFLFLSTVPLERLPCINRLDVQELLLPKNSLYIL